MQAENAGLLGLRTGLLACNYMQRPKNAAALSRDTTKRVAGFYEIEEFRARAHPSPFLFLSREVRDGSAVVFH